MSYEDTLKRLGSTVEDSIMAIWAQRRAGTLTAAQSLGMMETIIVTANAQGEAFGVLSFQAFMDTATGAAAPVAAQVTSLTPEARAATIDAIRAALEQPPHLRELSLRRMAFNAPVRMVTEAFRLEMRRDPRVQTYTRGLEGNACTLCYYLYKDGYPYPVTKPMHRHPGCVCSQVPNLGDSDGLTSEQRAAGQAAADRYELDRYGTGPLAAA